MTLRFPGVTRRAASAPIVLSALLSLAVVPGCDEDTKSSTPAKGIDAAPPPPNPALGRRPEDLKYDATISELTRFMRDLRVAIMSNDEPGTGLMIASLRLADHEAWMTKTFGKTLGKALSDDYAPQSAEIGLLAQVLREQFDRGLTEIDVGRYQTADNPSATGYQSAALRKMTTTVPLYSVRLISKDRKQSFHIWSFVHDKNSFRFVGKLHAVGEKKAVGGRDLNEYRLSDAERLMAQDK